jgi:RNase P subunit RPR2
MPAKTCAACDAPLDSKAISVTIGGKNVEVCCHECGEKLKDGPFSSKAVKRR